LLTKTMPVVRQLSQEGAKGKGERKSSNWDRDRSNIYYSLSDSLLFRNYFVLSISKYQHFVESPW
jgi:hypothetical protein